MWRSNAAFDGDKAIDGTSSYRSSLSLPTAKSFTSIGRHLTEHWRAKALHGLDDVQEGHKPPVHTPLPPVSEHASQSSLFQEWGFRPDYHPDAGQSIEQQPTHYMDIRQKKTNASPEKPSDARITDMLQ